MSKYRVEVEYVPEPGYGEIEWGWEAKVHDITLDDGLVGVENPYELSSKFSFSDLEEAKQNFEDIISPYLEQLNQTRLYVFDREV